MTAKQRKALEHLPAVIDALQALNREQEQLRGLLGATGVAAPMIQASQAAPPQPAGISPHKGAPNVISPEAQRELDAWRNSPARQKLLDEMRKPEEDELPAGMSA